MNLKLNLRAQAILRELINQHGIDCQIRPERQVPGGRRRQRAGGARSLPQRPGKTRPALPDDRCPRPARSTSAPASTARRCTPRAPSCCNRRPWPRPGRQPAGQRDPARTHHHHPHRAGPAHHPQARQRGDRCRPVADQQCLRLVLRLPAWPPAADLHLRQHDPPADRGRTGPPGRQEHLGHRPADPFGSTLRRTPDQRLLVRNSFSFNADGRANPRHIARAGRQHRDSFERRFPMLSGMAFEYTWGGSMACRATTCRTSVPSHPTCTRHCAATALASPVAPLPAPCWLTG